MSKKKTSKKAWQSNHRSQGRVFQNTGVYLMCNVPVFFLNKFGISDTVAKRQKNISETTPGAVFTVLSFDLAFGYKVEQFVHGLYKLQNIRFWTGSGRTEWFVVFSPIVGFSVLYMDRRFGFGIDKYFLAAAFFTPFVWWDGIFWLLLFRLLKFISIAATFIFVFYAIANAN